MLLATDWAGTITAACLVRPTTPTSPPAGASVLIAAVSRAVYGPNPSLVCLVFTASTCSLHRLKGKLHPITGQPLKIERLELPPGRSSHSAFSSCCAVDGRTGYQRRLLGHLKTLVWMKMLVCIATGSMVVVLHHSPHAVEPRPPGTGTRHCTLFSYRAPDPGGRLPVTTNADLQPWELERDAALGKVPGVPAGIPNLFSLY